MAKEIWAAVWRQNWLLIVAYFIHIVVSLTKDEVMSLFGPLHCSLEEPDCLPGFLVTLLLFVIVGYFLNWRRPIDCVIFNKQQDQEKKIKIGNNYADNCGHCPWTNYQGSGWPQHSADHRPGARGYF